MERIVIVEKKVVWMPIAARQILSGTTEGKLEKFFGLLEKKDQKAVEMWDVYTGYLAVALNNIHMLLDCDIILGGYVGSYAEPYLSDIWNKVSERNTFTEDQQFVTSSRYKVGAAGAWSGSGSN